MNLLIETRLPFSLVCCFPLFNEMKFQHFWSLTAKWIFSWRCKTNWTRRWENTEVKNRQHSPCLGNFSPSIHSQTYLKLSISQQCVHHTNNIFFPFMDWHLELVHWEHIGNIQAANFLRVERLSVFWTRTLFLDTRSILKLVLQY